VLAQQTEYALWPSRTIRRRGRNVVVPCWFCLAYLALVQARVRAVVSRLMASLKRFACRPRGSGPPSLWSGECVRGRADTGRGFVDGGFGVTSGWSPSARAFAVRSVDEQGHRSSACLDCIGLLRDETLHLLEVVSADGVKHTRTRLQTPAHRRVNSQRLF